MKCKIKYGQYSDIPGYWFEVFDFYGKLIATYHANQSQVLFGTNGFITQLRVAHNAYGKGSLVLNG